MKAKLLLVEDSEVQGSRLKQSLEALGYEVQWARSGISGLARAKQLLPDLIILDIVMADLDGISVCRWLKMWERTRDIPVIMLTERDQLERRIEGLQVGANDYLPKPFATEELEARIFAALRVSATHVELKERNAQLQSMLHQVESLAATDPLTGLFNRRRFTDVLQREYAVTRRHKTPLSCILVDLDHFKQVNDQYGHEVGDEVLRRCAESMASALREVDLIARYGGEEFVALLPQTDEAGALLVANRLMKGLRALEVDAGDATVRPTASFGVATTRSSEGEQADDVVRAADSAMYIAKQEGRDQIVVYSPELSRPLLSLDESVSK